MAWVMEVRAACEAIGSPVVTEEALWGGVVRLIAKVGPSDEHRRRAKAVAKDFQRRWMRAGLRWTARYNKPDPVMAERYREVAGPQRVGHYMELAEDAAAGSVFFRLGD